jgi:hypothetical protein
MKNSPTASRVRTLALAFALGRGRGRGIGPGQLFVLYEAHVLRPRVVGCGHPTAP